MNKLQILSIQFTLRLVMKFQLNERLYGRICGNRAQGLVISLELYFLYGFKIELLVFVFISMMINSYYNG